MLKGLPVKYSSGIVPHKQRQGLRIHAVPPTKERRARDQQQQQQQQQQRGGVSRNPKTPSPPLQLRAPWQFPVFPDIGSYASSLVAGFLNSDATQGNAEQVLRRLSMLSV